MSETRYFGIRHHGPGCARSLRAAFDAWAPRIVLVEGPPEADALLPHLPALVPPVAILSHVVDAPQRAVYHPFARFSPEWQALAWTAEHGVPARFIDLPQAHALALGPEDAADDTPRDDPLGALAEAAGFEDGEAWWNQQVEERSDAAWLFDAIGEAMAALRSGETPPRDARREAHMRQCLRAARREGFERIAVVCGAWHVPALRDDGITAKADAALLKGLPKAKVAATWVPWTYRHLTRASGYGAGVRSPGWYDHLWATHERPRAAGWLARVATLMRERDLDCSSGHLIEATRLAEGLSALRGRPSPGLDELTEATRAVLTMGDDTVLAFVRDALVVGDRLGEVPPDVPTVPLQRDLESQQKSLRLKPESLQKTLDLDLRQPNDLARSQLLHRLALLGIPWGTLAKLGKSARGSFHEVWQLQWQPEFALKLIEASRWGQTVEQAATAAVLERCPTLGSLADLSRCVDDALLAALPLAVQAATQALQDRAATSGDVPQLLAALPALANVFRYGNVRQTDAALVAQVMDGLVLRASLGLVLAVQQLDDDAAGALREHLLAAHAALRLRDAPEPLAAWRQALQLLADSASAHPLLKGLVLRLLLDDGERSADDAATAVSLHLSTGSEPAAAAAWLEGFLNGNAVVLLHDTTVWRLLDDWLAALSEEHFVRVLPLVRRSFSAFGPGERRDLATRARQGASAAPAAAAPVDWPADKAALPLPWLRRWLGVPA
ncbi:hypothetical protein D621_07425 [beta proteobacterium AAP51]|nr:hypothetical protein D621_07425 [beta proteobacterium AAP51]